MSEDQFRKLVDEYILSQAKRGEAVDFPTAAMKVRSKLHRAFIVREMWNRHGVGPSGFLVRAELVEPEPDADGKLVPLSTMSAIMNRYLAAENRLSGPKAQPLREALVRLGIPIDQSPTFPVAADKAA